MSIEHHLKRLLYITRNIAFIILIADQFAFSADKNKDLSDLRTNITFISFANDALWSDTQELSRRILSIKGVPVFVGRSCTPLSLYASLIGVNVFDLPLSKFKYLPSDHQSRSNLTGMQAPSPPLGDELIHKLYAQFDTSLPSDAELKGLPMIIIDYSLRGDGLRVLMEHIDLYRKVRNRKFLLKGIMLLDPEGKEVSKIKPVFLDSRTNTQTPFEIIDLVQFPSIREMMRAGKYDSVSKIGSWDVQDSFVSKYGMPAEFDPTKQVRSIDNHLELQKIFRRRILADEKPSSFSSDPSKAHDIFKFKFTNPLNIQSVDPSSKVWEKKVQRLQERLKTEFEYFGEFKYAFISTLASVSFYKEIGNIGLEEIRAARDFSRTYAQAFFNETPTEAEAAYLYHLLTRSIKGQLIEGYFPEMENELKKYISICAQLRSKM